MLHQLPVFGAEIGEDTLQACHRAGASVAVTQFEQNVALSLFDGEHRSDRSTPLSDNRIQAPAAANAESYRSSDNLISEEQWRVYPPRARHYGQRRGSQCQGDG